MGPETVLPMVLGGIGSTVLSGMMNRTPSAPAVPKPTVMPTADDEAAKQAKRRSIAAQMARSGRMSTILTNQPEGDTLG